jgi:hypothetical protein
MLYTGWGPLVVVVFLVITFGAQALFRELTGDGRYFLHHPFLGLLIFAIAGLVTWFVGKFMNRKPFHVEELDEHGRKLVPKAKHTIWFIPAEYWGPLLFVLLTFILLWKA